MEEQRWLRMPRQQRKASSKRRGRVSKAQRLRSSTAQPRTGEVGGTEAPQGLKRAAEVSGDSNEGSETERKVGGSEGRAKNLCDAGGRCEVLSALAQLSDFPRYRNGGAQIRDWTSDGRMDEMNACLQARCWRARHGRGEDLLCGDEARRESPSTRTLNALPRTRRHTTKSFWLDLEAELKALSWRSKMRGNRARKNPRLV